MCLLDILSEFNLNILAIHLNHNWRGEESDKEEENCRFFCKSKKIDFYCEKLPARLPRTETAARKARYDFFENCAKKFNSTTVLTAHNANDNAETIIYRMVKGTGITGLCGISEKREIFYRPLLKTKRSEIVDYCNENNLTPNNDSSNSNTAYTRNYLRLNVIPALDVTGFLPCRIQRRQQHARKNRDDRNNYEQLDKGETLPHYFLLVF